MGKLSGGREDPRVARTRRDVIRASAASLLEGGWEATTHAEVARRAGYSKATIYAHWPTPGDLMRDAIAHICDDATHPPATGNLREDLHDSLSALALTLSERQYDRLMASVIERAGHDEGARGLRDRLYETATTGIRSVLIRHLQPGDVEPCLAMLVGAVLVRATYEGEAVTPEFISDIIERALDRTTQRSCAKPDGQ
ncbi:AcrR family transcriptional regulator [Streptomyces sp. SAI-135]|jgi:AcrR family transcriptional regulator|uniref:TetR/AcrR family transcriptional regulator n=1 Tax=unclassified Streptomyces TaxID=2593676 RepID=UPI0024751183|nr:MULTISPECIES: TetR/AcrR family transcriptional regulator [unclassified Streptomyces]MDH6523068.1 AcrR family transcriptional regulator [Streptomyces sp. SAI-090]MDH6554680.1 AcrR family transcriptional regulator [Streptomyces sp. SAI-041]MDH6573951.1 AcrR family transcriptional regulator [Streptomyces sp. SAI-117]MDH6581312.1 AcrR family transcriptional regulator [Streptomyces sp. SAI-133]MDH6613319.1 AcrR family transcriptional regulator [Streptomyces sp. SAI-135]